MRTLPLLLAVFLATGGLPAAVPLRASVLTAVLTDVEGNVTIKEGPPRRRSTAVPVRRARFLQICKAGDRINVPAGAGAGFVCSNDHWVSLPAGSDQPLTEDLCRKGEPLPLGTYQRLAPVGGRMRSVAGAMALERKTRGPEEEGFGIPILLSPRNTALLEGRPEIVWTAVEGATDYEVEAIGSVAFRIPLRLKQVSCGPSSEWDGREVCSIAFPPSAPDIPPGASVTISVGARRGIASPLRREPEPSRIHRLPAETGEELRARLNGMAGLQAEEATLRVLEGNLYAENKAYASAMKAYREALSIRESPEVRVTLGDTYLAIGLLSPADRSYREAMVSGASPEAHAAAELGLGRIEYIRQVFDRAREHFSKARKLYRSQGLMEEAHAARRAAREAKRRQRTP
jgi:hypothetical protein